MFLNAVVFLKSIAQELFTSIVKFDKARLIQ